MEKNGKHNECNYLGHLELCEKALLDVTATFAPMLSQQPVNKLFLVWQCLSMSFWTRPKPAKPGNPDLGLQN